MYVKHFRRLVAVAVALVAGGVAGCGGGEISTAQGLVTVGGIPADVGSVKFISEADSKKIAVGPIKDGKYEVTSDRGLTPGKYKVEIIWQKNIPPKAGPAPKKVDPDLGSPTGGGGHNVADNPTRTASMPAEVKAGPNTIDFPIPK